MNLQQTRNKLLDLPGYHDRAPHRSRRSFLDLITGGVGLGVSIRNRMSLVDLKASVSVIRNHITELAKAQQANSMTLNTVLKETSKLVLTTSKIAREVIRLSNETEMSL